jgi:hypothetical protein
MIRKSEYFEQTDKFLNSDMTLPELKEFEIQMEIDSNLADEVNLHLDVEQAMSEKDIISLRSNLNQIVQNQTDKQYNEISVFDSFSFGLSEEFSSNKKLNNQISSDDILNFGHTFPKIHLYQHKIADKENIHQFYKEQFDFESVSEERSFSAFEEEIFTEVQHALDENDVFDLRANLSQIAHTMPSHQYSAEDLENYANKSMDESLRNQFEEELATNSSLAKDLKLFTEIDLAGAETDIMNLRASLNEIQKNEFHSHTSSIEEIENYINNELSEEELASFEAELTSNYSLNEEIKLIKNIDKALIESDVMQLRSKLQGIAHQIASEKRTERSFSGKIRLRSAVVISSIAASLILLLGITGLLSRHSSQEDIYQKFYNRYETAGIVRAASLSADQTLSIALQKFDNKEYKAALDLFAEVISNDQSNMAGHFYSGVALQETGKYQNAIQQYQTVITNKDNLFMEQAQWYIGLCYLQSNENKKAYKIFRKIATNEGFYQQKADAILQKIEDTE